ncbi:STAS-like domain-containing protein [Sphingobacterium sp. MYb388]|uniref:STAS-like domain-containing protein n=1 Tax=Sphingobacterium sp. MYb388 TaxID=2745437 RepID=UPI00309717CD
MDVKLKIKDIIQSHKAVSSDNGDKVFRLIKKNLDTKNYLVLDFDEIELIITAFLNAAIGQLYSNNLYESSFLNEHIKFDNIKQRDVKLFKDVVETAKIYFANKASFEKHSDNTIYGKN